MKIIVWVVSPIVPGEPLMLTLFVNWVTGMCLPELQKSLLVMSMSGISITREIAKMVMRTEMGYLANVCSNCGICPYANRKPRSAFNWVMRWHRSWCPAWTAHSKVYGMKSLSG